MHNIANRVKHSAVNSRMFYSRILIVLLFAFAVFSKPYIVPDSPLEVTMDFIGYFLIIACVLGRIFCSVFIAGRKTIELVTTGPFSLVRNPLYVFSFIGMVGIALQFSMITIPIVLILIFCFYYPHVVNTEEQRLLDTFGQPYEDYRQQVPRWFPRSLKMTMPETIETNPKIILKSLRDASLFFLSLPALELLEALHHHIIPTFWHVF